jgi:hypothetical protein
MGGKCSTIGDIRNVYRILIGKPEGKKCSIDGFLRKRA